VCNDKGSGHNLKAKHPRKGSLPEVVRHEGIVIACLFEQCAMNAVEHCCEISSRTTARIENANIRGRQAERLSKLSAEELIHALYHVMNNFARGIPDPKLSAEFMIEGFKEWLVKVGDGLLSVKGLKEGGLDAIESCACEI
jgi:hypothetical protein